MYEVEQLADIFKALSDPTRLRLVKLLVDYDGALCVNALAQKLGVTQSAVSQHLRVLRQVGLVQGERYGPFVHYSVYAEGLERYRVAVAETLGNRFAKG